MALLRQKNNRISLEKWFELVKPSYVYLKITPDKSIRNYNSVNIAKAIKHTYRAITKKIKFEQKKLWVQTSFKVSYIIDIKNGNVDFYFLVPECFLPVLQEKVREIWSKATLSIEENIEEINKNADCYQVYCKKEDALSLNVDRKNNEPLNSILTVMEIMKNDDRVTIVYNFLPRNNFGWDKQYKDTMEKYRLKQPLDNHKLNMKYAIKSFLCLLIITLDCVTDSICEFVGADIKKGDNALAFTEALATALSNNEELSVSTKKKKTASILDTQIAVISESNDSTRKENNAISVCHAFSSLDEKGGNELIYNKIKEKFNIYKYRFDGIRTNNFSCEEASNCILIPGRSLLRSFNINHIKVNEVVIPKELQSGKKRLGCVTYKGNKIESFLEDEYNVGNLPMILIGAMGGGKSTFMGNYAKDCCESGESVIGLDYIKNCELSDTIKKYVPNDRLIEIDLANSEQVQGLGFNEVSIKSNMKAFDKIKLANIQSQQIMALIDSISVGDPLSSRMRRFLNAAANVSFVTGETSVKSVVRILEDYKYRKTILDKLDDELKALLEDDINVLGELNEWSKVSKADSEKGEVSEIIGTRESKIEHILDRVSMLREDFKLKYMYNKSLDNNINLVDCMEQGKIVLIKMRESDFPSKMSKNILATYWISKIWLASQLRGEKHDKPMRTNVLVDEIFQAPTCMSTLEYILPQSRKFGCKFVFTTQYIRQLNKIFDTLEASGSSYMLLKGCLEDDFNHFKSKLDDFDFEDLRDMKQFDSLNLIYYSGGYASFISKLPKPLKKVIKDKKTIDN